MSNKLTLEGLQTFLEKIGKRFSRKNHKHTFASIEGLDTAIIEAGFAKTVNNIEPDSNGNVQITFQEVISDLEEIRNNASAGASLVSTVNSMPTTYATKAELTDLTISPSQVEGLEESMAQTSTDISAKADLSGAVFTGPVTVPKIITETGLEIY